MSLSKLAGFALLELAVVVAAATILLMIAVPHLESSLSADRLATSSDQLAAEIDFARTLAISRNTTYILRFNAGRNSYQILDPEDLANPPRAPKTLEPGVFFASTTTPDIRFFARGYCQGATIQLANRTGQSCIVRVQPSGSVKIGSFESHEYY